MEVIDEGLGTAQDLEESGRPWIVSPLVSMRSIRGTGQPSATPPTPTSPEVDGPTEEAAD